MQHLFWSKIFWGGSVFGLAIFLKERSPLRQGPEQMTCRKPRKEEKLTNTVCLDRRENVKRKSLMCVHKDGLSVFIQILTGEPCKHVDCGRPSVPSDVQLFSNFPSGCSWAFVRRRFVYLCISGWLPRFVRWRWWLLFLLTVFLVLAWLRTVYVSDGWCKYSRLLFSYSLNKLLCCGFTINDQH